MDHKASIRRYFWVLVAALVVVVALALLVLALTGLLPPATVSFVPIALAAFDAGRERQRIAEAPLSFGDWMRLTAALTLITLALYAFILAGAALSQGASLVGMVSLVGRLAGPVAIFLALAFATIRLMLWLGARTRR
ncbi:MAG: ABZJ_00895 family protein [Pseudomonadota bacterium]